MRPPRESLLLLGLMTAVCLFAGLIAGIASGYFPSGVQATSTASPPPASTATSAAAETVAVTPGIQKTLLLLGVTDAYSPDQTLEACWVISFRSGFPEYYVMAFPPSVTFEVPGLAGPHTLSQINAEDVRLQLDHNFVRDAVETRFPGFDIQAEVVLDRSDVSALVGELGGVPFNNQLLTGPMLLQTYDAWPAATELDRLSFQDKIMHVVFALMDERGWTAADVTAFLTANPRIAADASTTAELQRFAQDAPDITVQGLRWSTYQPALEAGAAPPAEGP